MQSEKIICCVLSEFPLNLREDGGSDSDIWELKLGVEWDWTKHNLRFLGHPIKGKGWKLQIWLHYATGYWENSQE